MIRNIWIHHMAYYSLRLLQFTPIKSASHALVPYLLSISARQQKVVWKAIWCSTFRPAKICLLLLVIAALVYSMQQYCRGK